MDGGIVAVLTAVGINTLYAVRHGHSLFVTVMGGGVLLLFVSGLNAVPGSTVGTSIGVTFLLATIIYRGQDLMQFITSLLGG
jgi:hypothetical protein